MTLVDRRVDHCGSHATTSYTRMREEALMNSEKTTPEGTPEYRHRMKIAKENEDREKNTKTVAEYIELSPNPNHPKGGKVLQVSITNNGYKHRTYLGREKQVGAVILKAKRAGNFYLVGQEPPVSAKNAKA